MAVRPSARSRRCEVFKHRGFRMGIATLAVGALLAGCGSDGGGLGRAEPQFGYQLPTTPVTTNAGSAVGVATDAAKLSARLYPGAFLAGPEGQMLPNRDLVEVTPSKKHQEVVDYKINPAAKYSDGHKVVCDDFQLTKLASERADLFASDLPIYHQVAELYCAPGADRFRVVFKPGFGQRYRELFSAGTVLPAHAVTKRAEVESVTATVESGVEEDLLRLGKAWQELFDITKTDPATVPTFGPYRIAEKGERGQLVLRENSEWAGDRPAQLPIYVWGPGADLPKLAEDNQISVLDAPVKTDFAAAGIASEKFSISRQPSDRLDTLSLADTGIFADEGSRHAFSSCIDRKALVKTTSEFSRNRVTATGLRVLQPSAPTHPRLKALSGAHMTRDIPAAKAALEGATVRIGYLQEHERYAKQVETIKNSCAEAGITVEAVPLTATNYGTLGEDYDALLSTLSGFGRNGLSKADQASLLPEILRAEKELQQAMWTIPLTTEPRAIATLKNLDNVVDNPGNVGLSWNMDRWVELDHTPETTSATDTSTKKS